MKYNDFGDLTGGVGGYGMWKPRGKPLTAIPGSLTKGAWLDANTILGAKEGMLWRVTATGTPVVFDHNVPSKHKAGGGAWASTTQAGTYPSRGQLPNGASLPTKVANNHWIVDAGRHGTLIFQDFFSHIWAVWPDGAVQDCGITVGANGVAVGDWDLSHDAVVIWNGTTLRVVTQQGTTVCDILEGADLNHPMVSYEMVSYAANGIGRVMHPIESASWGYHLTEGFSPDVLLLDGVWRCAVATNAGEVVVAEKVIPLIQEPVRLREDAPVPVPGVPEPAVDDGLALPTYGWPIAFCNFQSWNHREDWGNTDDEFGNMAMPEEGLERKTALPLIQFLGPDGLGGVKGFMAHELGRTWAYFIHHEGPLEEVRQFYEAVLALPEKPIILYAPWTETVPPWWVNRDRTFPTTILYRDQNESLVAFDARQREKLSRMFSWGMPLGVIPQAFDRAWGGAGKDAAIEAYPVIDQLVRDFMPIVIMPFTDMRPGGMNDHPEIKQRYKRMALACVRPNTYDGWLCSQWKQKLRSEKLDYTRLILRPEEKAYLRSL